MEKNFGNNKDLNAPKVATVLLDCFSRTVLKEREKMTNAAKDANVDWKDPHDKFLSFEEEQAALNFTGDKKTRPKPTYSVELETFTESKDADGKTIKTKTGVKKTEVKNKAKWLMVTASGKNAMVSMLKRYCKEILDFYTDGGNKFPDESNLLSEFETYTSSPTDFGVSYIAPFILRLTDKVDANKFVEPVYGELDTLLLKKLGDQFKTSEGSPTAKLTKLIEKWVQFVKLLAVSAAHLLWYKRLQCNVEFVQTLLRQLLITTNNEATLDELFFNNMNDYCDECERVMKVAAEERKIKAANKPVVDASANEPVVNDFETTLEAAAVDDDIGDALSNESGWEESAMNDV